MGKPFNFEQFVDKYRRLREKKAELKAKHEEELAPYNEALAAAEGVLLRHLEAQGVDSAKTPSGTVYKRLERSASVVDWDKVLDYVRENEAWHLLNRSVAKVAAWDAAEAGEPVPGVNLTSYAAVGVRKPERKK